MRLRGATRETPECRPRLGQWARRRDPCFSGERGCGAAVLACGTQWRFAAMSGHLLGLDYAGAWAAARFMALERSPELFDKCASWKRKRGGWLIRLMPDNLKINLELTVDGKSRKVDIDKVAANAENAAEARQQSVVTSENSREGVHGLLRGLEKYASEATNAAQHVEEAFKRAFKNIENQLVRLITKASFLSSNF